MSSTDTRELQRELDVPRHARPYSSLRDKLRAIKLHGYRPTHRVEL